MKRHNNKLKNEKLKNSNKVKVNDSNFEDHEKYLLQNKINTNSEVYENQQYIEL